MLTRLVADLDGVAGNRTEGKGKKEEERGKNRRTKRIGYAFKEKTFRNLINSKRTALLENRRQGEEL